MNYSSSGSFGSYGIDANGKWYWKRNANDGHGGNALEHRREMTYIAEQVVQQKLNEAIPEIQRQATEQAYNNLLEALSFDVTSAVNIGFENGESIFKDKKTQKVVAEAVMKEVRKQLKNIR